MKIYKANTAHNRHYFLDLDGPACTPERIFAALAAFFAFSAAAFLALADRRDVDAFPFSFGTDGSCVGEFEGLLDAECWGDDGALVKVKKSESSIINTIETKYSSSLGALCKLKFSSCLFNESS